MDGLGQGCDAKQVNPIEAAVDLLHQELVQLQDCVTTLHGRLSATMISDKTIKEMDRDKVTIPEMSPLLSSIKEACSKLKTQRRRLSDILTRTQI